MITVTQAAVEKVKGYLKRGGKGGYGLRVRVVGGGCSGLEYRMDYEEAAAEGDQVIEAHGLKVFVDPTSAVYLAGVEIDYLDGLKESGFKIRNPSAKTTCGCGESFSV